MGHDLQFEIQNGDGSRKESPIRGEMDHLPDTRGYNTHGAAGAAHRQQGGGGGSAGGGGLQFIQAQLQQSSHPMVIIFHLLFKSAALVLYIFGGWLVDSKRHGNNGARFITLTVICILLLAADFWVVKNVTGRLLVGLRWWNQVEDDTTKWIFESAEDSRIAVNKFDRTVFWTVLYGTPAVWVGLFLLGILKFNFTWLLIVVMALALSLANVYGYYKCSTEQAAQFQQMMQAGAQQGAMAMMRSNMLSVLTGTKTSVPGTSNNNIV
jgi:Eukaryotic protein of unknown function (DUF846)